MVRADFFILGYRKILFSSENAERIATLLLRYGISASLNGGFFLIRERDFLRIQKQLSPLVISIGELSGLGVIIKRAISARGVIAALLLLAVTFSFFGGVVWDVRVISDGTLTNSSITAKLRSHGFGVGTRWSSVDTSDIENKLLLSSDDVSWISINRRGTVAYVEVLGKSREDTPSEDGGYSNVVASCDCVIEEITVSSGYAVVSVGDAVSEGDLLISGILPAEAGGGYCRAEGVVKGRLSGELSVSVDRKEVKKELIGYDVSAISLQIFDFSINIFKRYGNVERSCDIIKDIEELIVFGKYKLPISLTKAYTAKYEERVADYTDAQIVGIATSRLNSLIKAELYSSEVVAIRSFGDFTDAGYTAWASITVLSDVGKLSDFEIQEK